MMSCPKCGSPLMPGAAYCAVCNEPLAAYPTQPVGMAQPGMQPGYPGYGQPGYPAQGVPQPAPQSAMPEGWQQPVAGGYPTPAGTAQQAPAPGYQPGAFPPGYQPPVSYGQPMREGSPLLTSLTGLPRAFLDSFARPAELMRTLVERGDRLTGLIVAAAVLLLGFLGGMVLARSLVGELFSALSRLMNVNLANSAASMNQGVSYVAGRIAPSVGGVAALCQLIGMLVPALTFMVYLCAVLKARFSLELMLGFVAVTSLPTVAASLLSMLGALLTPWLSVLCILCGMAVSYTQACGLLPVVTGKPDAELYTAKLLIVVISLFGALVVGGVVGGLLMNGVMRRMAVLLTSVGSLI